MLTETSKRNSLSFSGNTRLLYLTRFAFFLAFFVWFNHAPLMGALGEALNLTDQQVNTLLALNSVLIFPARIILAYRWFTVAHAA